MRKICIHFKYKLIPFFDGPLKPMNIGSAEAKFARALLKEKA